MVVSSLLFFFFFQAEDGIRDPVVTGVQTCALPIFGIPEDKVVVLYAGNMGVKQGLEIVVEAAWGMRKNAGVHFVLCGEGSARPYLERAAREMRNVQFLPLQPQEKLNRLLNAADVHLLPQRVDVADQVMPSKLLGMLAS